MAIEIQKETTVTVSSKDFIENLTIDELGEFCSDIAKYLDNNFSKRAWTAGRFAQSLSEQGCRWIAEVVASHFMRKNG